MAKFTTQLSSFVNFEVEPEIKVPQKTMILLSSAAFVLKGGLGFYGRTLVLVEIFKWFITS